MKLWQKIFLYTMMLVMLAVSVTSILLLKNSFQLAVAQKKQAAYTEHEFLITNFKSMLLSERLRQNAILLEGEQIIAYMEETFENENIKSGIAFYNWNLEQVYRNPEQAYLTQEIENSSQATENSSQATENSSQATENSSQVAEDNSQVAEDSSRESGAVQQLLEIVSESGESYMQVQEEHLYIVSKETLETNTYYFLTVTDLGDVLSMHRDMLNRVRITSMICAVAIAAVLLVVVKLLMLPLQKINEGTRAIAQGEYERRVPQKGKDEISELAHNMNQMAQAVEKNIKALEDVAEDRKQFIDNLSHEMKTPLTSILGFSDLLQIKSDLSEEQRVEYAGIIKDEASRLRTLSGKLMEMITVGEANVEWHQEEVQQVFAEVAVSMGVVARSHGVHLAYQCQKGKLWMDKELVKSLVYNLADNAIKASKEGGNIRITGWFEQEVFFFSVADQGIGIPKEEIDKITQAFYMVDKVRSRASGGAGLGLALCVEIARMHRGNLRIESEPGVGTTVTVRMKGGIGNEAC